MTADVLVGMNWVIEHHQAGQPAVANISIGGPASSRDRRRGEGDDLGRHHRRRGGRQRPDRVELRPEPGRVPEAITVAASTATDGRAVVLDPRLVQRSVRARVDILSASDPPDTGSIAGRAGRRWRRRMSPGGGADPAATPRRTRRPQVWEAIDLEATTGVIAGDGADEPDKLLHIAPRLVPPAPTGLTATVAAHRGLAPDRSS